jgi:hypothetical protein
MSLQTVQSSEESLANQSAEAVFTGTATFVAHGQVVLNATSNAFSPSTRVIASIVEIDSNGVPSIGAARMTIHNVRPYHGGVQVSANIEWDSNLRVRVSYLWEN